MGFKLKTFNAERSTFNFQLAFAERAGKPTLPTALRIKHALDSHAPWSLNDYGYSLFRHGKCACSVLY